MFSIIPRDRTFFDLFEKAAGIVIRAAETYDALVRDYDHRMEHVARIRQL